MSQLLKAQYVLRVRTRELSCWPAKQNVHARNNSCRIKLLAKFSGRSDSELTHG